MKVIVSVLFFFISILEAGAQIATGTTQASNNGGGTLYAPCTEILKFDNYNDNLAGSVNGQDFLFTLMNGYTLSFNLRSSGGPVASLAVPATPGSSFGVYGYSGITGKPVLYTSNYSTIVTLTFSNIAVRDLAGNLVADYTLAVFDGEGTGGSETITISAPTGNNWYNWDSLTPPLPRYTPVKSGVGTNIVLLAGNAFSTYYTSFGVAVDSPSSISVALDGLPSGKEGMVLGIERIIRAVNDTVCSNTPFNIGIINAAPGTTYTWTAPVVNPPGSITGGSAQTSGVGSISQTLIHIGSSTATATYTITPVSCGRAGKPFTGIVVISDSGTISISPSSALFCVGDSVTLTAISSTSDSGGVYTWLPGGASSASITVSPAAATTIYTVSYSHSGCLSTDTASVIQNNISVSASSVNTTCGNNNGSVNVIVTSGIGPFIYNWSNGSDTATVFNLGTGNYIITVTGDAGCSATAAVTVGTSGTNSVTINADKIIFCSGDSAHICAPSIYASYLWNTGETAHCIYTKLAGNYYVTVTDVNGCTATSNRLAINVHPLPPVSISVNGDTLTVYDAVTQQWYLNGSAINNATSNVYIAAQSGSYTVAVTDTNGCVATSSPVIISGIDNISEEDIVSVYPNPFSENFGLRIADFEFKQPLRIEIFQTDGRVVFQSEIRNAQSEIAPDVAKGVYLLRISSGKSSVIRKLIRL